MYFPNIKTGDFSPTDTLEYDEAYTNYREAFSKLKTATARALDVWLRDNIYSRP